MKEYMCVYVHEVVKIFIHLYIKCFSSFNSTNNNLVQLNFIMDGSTHSLLLPYDDIVFGCSHLVSS